MEKKTAHRGRSERQIERIRVIWLSCSMRNLLIIAESKWAPSPCCPPMTEQWRVCRCYTSDYSLYPWVISNLRSTLSKQVDITCRTPMKITEFLLEEEADDNKNLYSLSLPHPGRKGIITPFIHHYRHPPFVLDEFVQRAVGTWSEWGIVDQQRLLRKGKKKNIWSTNHMMCHSRWR